MCVGAVPPPRICEVGVRELLREVLLAHFAEGDQVPVQHRCRVLCRRSQPGPGRQAPLLCPKRRLGARVEKNGLAETAAPAQAVQGLLSAQRVDRRHHHSQSRAKVAHGMPSNTSASAPGSSAVLSVNATTTPDETSPEPIALD